MSRTVRDTRTSPTEDGASQLHRRTFWQPAFHRALTGVQADSNADVEAPGRACERGGASDRTRRAIETGHELGVVAFDHAAAKPLAFP